MPLVLGRQVAEVCPLLYPRERHAVFPRGASFAAPLRYAAPSITSIASCHAPAARKVPAGEKVVQVRDGQWRRVGDVAAPARGHHG